jgi:hypothetical protein
MSELSGNIQKSWGEIRSLYMNVRNKKLEEGVIDGDLLKLVEDTLPHLNLELNTTPLLFCTKYLMNGFSDFMMMGNAALYFEILAGKLRCPCKRHFHPNMIPENCKIDSEALTIMRPSGVKLDEFLCLNKKPNNEQLNKSSLGQYSRLYMIIHLLHFVKVNFDAWSRRFFYNVYFVEGDNIYITICYFCLFANRDIFNSDTHELSIIYWLKHHEFDFFYKELDYDNLSRLLTKVIDKNTLGKRKK